MERARGTFVAAGVDSRCSYVGGSFFEALPVDADAYLMRHIIHDWTDEQSTTILSCIRQRIPENGRLLLIETSSKDSYGATQAFYLRCGYRELARIPAFYRPGDNKLVYGKYLS